MSLQSEMIKQFLREALVKSLKTGGTTMLEELAEALTEEQRRLFVSVLTRVQKRRSSTVDMPRENGRG